MAISSKDMEVTPLVAYGLVFLLLIGGGLGLERFWRAEQVRAQELVAAQNELATLRALRGDNPWAERFEQSQALRQAVTARLWQGQTAGVIAAELQQALRREAGGLGFDGVQVRVDPEVVEVEGRSVLSFEFAGRAPDGKAVASIIEAIAGHSKQIVIRDVDFAQNIRDRRPPRVAMSGIIPIEIVAVTAQSNLAPRPARPVDPMVAPSSQQRVSPRQTNTPPQGGNR